MSYEINLSIDSPSTYLRLIYNYPRLEWMMETAMDGPNNVLPYHYLREMNNFST